MGNYTEGGKIKKQAVDCTSSVHTHKHIYFTFMLLWEKKFILNKLKLKITNFPRFILSHWTQ